MAEFVEAIEQYGLTKKSQPKGTISKVGLIGCGSMGQEITLAITRKGIDLVFIDISEERVKEVIDAIECRLDIILNHWGMTESEKRGVMNRIKGSTDYNDLTDCDLIIETINTKKPGTSLELRKEVFANIEKVVKPETVIASNTATLMISELAEVLEIPERAIGMHFISPADKINIIEVVRSIKTNDETHELVEKFSKMIGRKVINLNESPGNISTRMIVPMINEACEILMEGVASIQDIDDTMKQATGHQFGPFEMADRIGLDKVLKWMNNLYSEFGEQKYKPSPILKRLVRSNLMGRRNNKGFYRYENGNAVAQNLTCAEIKK